MEMTKETYFEKLQKMDWFYHFSDDMRVWRSGEVASSELAKISETDPVLKKMYNDYTSYVYFRGESSLRPKKPELLDYE